MSEIGFCDKFFLYNLVMDFFIFFFIIEFILKKNGKGFFCIFFILELRNGLILIKFYIFVYKFLCGVIYINN